MKVQALDILLCSSALVFPGASALSLGLFSNVFKGNGLIEGSLGALAGALGVETSYDYVVVGGGTAGNTIAARLAEAGHSVAIIEAGRYYQVDKLVLGSVPVGDVFGVGMSPLDVNPLVDWNFLTEPQAGANNRQFHYARGKCLGGSSALNFMIYQRGNAQCYNEWAELLEDDSYTFDNLMPHFKRSFKFSPPDTSKRLANATTQYRAEAFDNSQPGPVEIGYTNFVGAFPTWLQKAMNAVGIQTIQDFNSGSLLGSQYLSTTIRPKDATRSSSMEFVTASQNSQNLKVYLNTLAKRILFDGNKSATGVEVESLGTTYTIHATKEVIVSAGAFQSPQLLMVSGIGPAEQLQRFDIDVISDLPGVGQNMWDHIMFGPSYRVNVLTLNKVLSDLVYLLAAAAKYLTQAAGELSSNVVEFLGWEKISALPSYASGFSAAAQQQLSQFPADWPEAEWLSINSDIGNFLSPITQQPADGHQYATVLGAIVAPTSRGNVSLASADTADLPLINPNWLTTTADRELAVAMYRRMREIWSTEALQAIVVGDEYYPGRRGVATDAEILATVRESLLTVWHASCTCKMGGDADAAAVLDARARVRGVGALRVVDASSFPTLPPGHPQSTVYMLAEKIAQHIIDGE